MFIIQAYKYTFRCFRALLGSKQVIRIDIYCRHNDNENKIKRTVHTKNKIKIKAQKQINKNILIHS